MSVTIVNDYFFVSPSGLDEGKAAAEDLVRHFREEEPAVQLSLWLESRDNPLHHYHITVFDDLASLERVKKSAAIEKFVERLFPHIDHSTYTSPLCDVWLADGQGVQGVRIGQH